MTHIPVRLLRSVAVSAAVLLVASACGSSAGPPTTNRSAAPRIASTTSPAIGGPTVGPQGGGAISHPPVVLIVMENHEYSSIVGSSDAGYLNRGLIGLGLLFTHYDAVSHPSLPNYLAMTSGSTQGTSGTDTIASGEISSDNLFHQLATAGIRWRALQESLPSACDRTTIAGTSPASTG